MLEIRKITEGEITSFHGVYTRILRECFPEYPDHVLEYFITSDFAKAFLDKKMQDWDYAVLLALDKGKIVGFLMKEKVYAGVSFCNWLGVLKDYQGQGVGSRLLQKWEEEVLAEGGHKLMLNTNSPKNRKFYSDRGFVEEGFQRQAWFGLDYWVFGKVIAEPKPV